MRRLRLSSNRFVPRNDYTYPELRPRRPRASRRLILLTSRTDPRSGSSAAWREGAPA